MVRKKIIRRLVRSLTNSMIGYEVLGTPEGRSWTIRGIAEHMYRRMSKSERDRWLKKN